MTRGVFFKCAVTFFPALYELEHQGISIYHLVFDRAMHDPMVRRYKQHLSVLMQTGVSRGSASSRPFVAMGA